MLAPEIKRPFLDGLNYSISEARVIFPQVCHLGLFFPSIRDDPRSPLLCGAGQAPAPIIGVRQAQRDLLRALTRGGTPGRHQRTDIGGGKQGFGASCGVGSGGGSGAAKPSRAQSGGAASSAFLGQPQAGSALSTSGPKRPRRRVPRWASDCPRYIVRVGGDEGGQDRLS